MMSFNIITLGCKVNTYESEFIHSLFIKKGYVFCAGESDIYVVNTCTVTSVADKKSRQVINSLRKNHPDSIIVVCGCFAQNCYHENKLEEIKADIIIGNKDKSKIVDLVEAYLENRNKIIRFYDIKHQEFEDMEIKETAGKTRAFVKIEDGCNNFCTYCVIPFIRGCVRSKKHKLVIDEIKELVSNGYKEVVLTGIHTGAYKDEDYDFADLLNDLVKIKGLLRLRISSIEINELNDRVLDIYKNSDILVPHLHIPLQSGSDNVLKLMNRKYDTSFFEERINYIRKIKKDISITTDVIVGFPSETEKMHKESLKFIEKIGFSKVHVFPYSDRFNTVASKIENKVNPIEKKKRVKELIDLSKRLENEFYKKYYNKSMEVLFEESKNGLYIGHTANYIKIGVKDKHNTNEICEVKLLKDNIIMSK